MRDRLIELLKVAKDECLLHWSGACVDCSYKEQEDCTLENIVGHLLANGVIVPLCNVGDTVYMPFDGEITPFFIYQIRTEETVDFITKCYDARGYDTRGNPVSTSFCDYHIGKSVFLTKEEAEQALKEREQSDL